MPNMKFISYGILNNFYYQTGIPCIPCSTDDQVINALQRYSDDKFTLVCTSQDVPVERFPQIDPLHRIREIYIFGESTISNINNTKVTIVDTNENDLVLQMICSAIDYIHDDETQLRKLNDHRAADERVNEILRLLDLIKIRYVCHA